MLIVAICLQVFPLSMSSRPRNITTSSTLRSGSPLKKFSGGAWAILGLAPKSRWAIDFRRRALSSCSDADGGASRHGSPRWVRL